MHDFIGIFRKGHVHDLTGMHDLTGNLAYDDFFRKTHAGLYCAIVFFKGSKDISTIFL